LEEEEEEEEEAAAAAAVGLARFRCGGTVESSAWFS
jgi:hypothetical protein